MSGPGFPGNMDRRLFLCRCPCLCDFGPRCSTIWPGLIDILWHSSAANNIGFTNVLATREQAAEADISGKDSLTQNNSVFSGKRLNIPERSEQLAAMFVPQDPALHRGHRWAPDLCRASQNLPCEFPRKKTQPSSDVKFERLNSY